MCDAKFSIHYNCVRFGIRVSSGGRLESPVLSVLGLFEFSCSDNSISRPRLTSTTTVSFANVSRMRSPEVEEASKAIQLSTLGYLDIDDFVTEIIKRDLS